MQALVADDRNTTWTREVEVPGTATLNAGGHVSVQAVSCTAAGDCTAGGGYSPGGTDASGSNRSSDAFVVTETGGKWGTAIEVPGTAALNAGKSATVTAVSCWSPGNCLAAGSYATGFADGSLDTMAFLVTETKGTWGKAEAVPGLAALNVSDMANATSVSCPAAGECVIGGQYSGAAGLAAFVADQAGGIWQAAQQVRGTGGVQQFWVSCTARGRCGGDGTLDSSNEEALVADENGGTWGVAHVLPAQALTVGPLSCSSAGNCAAGGTYMPVANKFEAYVISEVNGKWGGLQAVPGLASMNAGNQAGIFSTSCASNGNCVAGGFYADEKSDYSNQAFLVAEASGTWGHARPDLAAHEHRFVAEFGEDDLRPRAVREALGDRGVGGSHGAVRKGDRQSGREERLRDHPEVRQGHVRADRSRARRRHLPPVRRLRRDR